MKIGTKKIDAVEFLDYHRLRRNTAEAGENTNETALKIQTLILHGSLQNLGLIQSALIMKTGKRLLEKWFRGGQGQLQPK